MARRDGLIKKRKRELQAKGYPQGIVDLSMEWAVGSAEGAAKYARRVVGEDNPGEDFDTLVDGILPDYLRDAEKWIQSFGHKRKSVV